MVLFKRQVSDSHSSYGRNLLRGEESPNTARLIGGRMVAGNARPGKPEGCEQRRHAPRGARHRGHKLCALVSPAGNDGGETAKFLPTCKAVPSCAKHKEIPKYKTHITNKLQNPNDQNTKLRVSVIVVLNLAVV